MMISRISTTVSSVCGSDCADGGVSGWSDVGAAISAQGAAHLPTVRALRMTGMEAIRYLSQCEERRPRPVMEALLRRLPVDGMST